MNARFSFPAAVLALLLLGGVAPEAAATAQRTFVASTGNDANPCSLTAPCRSFTAAIALANAGGEVVVLDSAGYGAVTIGKAVAIAAPPGVYAGISVLAGAGVTVSAAPGDVVTLRGLTINAQGGSTGIAFNSGDALYVDSVIVSGFSGPGGVGLSAATGGATSSLFVRNSVLRDNATGLFTATTGGKLTLRVEQTVLERNGAGADLRGTLIGTIRGSTFTGGATGLSAGLAGSGKSVDLDVRNSTITRNTGAGLAATAATSPTSLTVIGSLVSQNGTGIQVAGGGNNAYVSDSTILRNAIGLNATATGAIYSHGDNRLIYNAVDGAFTVNQAPVVNAGVSQTITLPGTAALSGTVSDDGQPAPPGAVSIAWSKDSGPGVVTFGNPGSPTTTASFSAAGAHVLRLTANDGALSAFATVTVTVEPAPPAGTLPPDPASVAPPIDPTLATDFGSANAFLYTGANPIQTGVAPGTIDPKRAAVIRGRLLDKSNNALPGVTVTLRNHPEYGQTLTRADGRFDIAVNGGGTLTLHYAKPGLLPAQRQVVVPWLDYAYAGDTILIGQDARVTTVDLGNTAPAFHVAQGSVVTDQDGTRQTTLLIPQGTQARVYNPDGSTRLVTTLNLRFTEYTIGANGPTTMPAQLPPSSAYTYAFEATAAEADVKLAGKDVLFDRPVPFYVDNFLNFPVGIVVPVGYYDQDRGEWIPSDNGRVIKILAIAAGVADIDSNGDGVADDVPTLAALGITLAERQQLAGLYPAGKTLWRVPVTHLSRWDCNWPFKMPDDAVSPQQAEPNVANGLDDPNAVCGSIIECQNQALRESVPIVGTGLTLNYASSWMAGNKTKATAVIPVSGTQLPASLKRIDLRIDVAGRHFAQQLPVQQDQRITFTWDGIDIYGRAVVGAVPALIRIGYVYDPVYAEPDQLAAAFARFSGVPLEGSRARNEVIIWQEHTTSLTGVSPKGLSLAGWSLDVHHSYDPAGRTLYLGTGGRRLAGNALGSVIVTVAGNGQGYTPGYGDGGPAVDAGLFQPSGIAVAPDGSLYFAEEGNDRIRLVSTNGIITTVAGNTAQTACGPDGGPAVATRLCGPTDVALAPDGSLYIAESGNGRVRRVGADGIITTFAGSGPQGSTGDGGPATSARLLQPVAVAVGPDGSLYIADEQDNRIRRVGTDGIITTVAGTGTVGSTGDGGPSTQARLTYPSDVAVGPDGSIFIADTYNHLIRRVGPDGIITTVAGKRNLNGPSGDGWLATEAGLWYPTGVEVAPDGSLFISDSFYPRIRYVGVDGIINTIAGDGTNGFTGDGGPATVAKLYGPSRLGLDAAGVLYIPDRSNNRVRRVVPTLPRFAAGNLVIASDDGAELYRFDAAGRRHLDTVHALTGAIRYAFGYDGSNRLTTVTDGNGNVTTVERNAGGQPTAIVSPYGQRTTLTLDANGYVATVTNPAGEVHRLTYTSGGLLTEFKNPRGNASPMIYDAVGRLTKDSDAAGGFKALARTEADRTYGVALSTALGRTTGYRVDDLLTGSQKRITTAPNGTQSELLTGTDFSRKTTLPDGTIVNLFEGPDPRFSMQAPIPTSQTTSTGGLTYTFAMNRAANLSNPIDPLTLVSQTDTMTLNGRVYTSSYLSSTRTFTDKTPANRQSTTTLDAQGRPIGTQVAGLEPSAVTYDSRGRIATIVAGTGGGARTYTLAYNAEGFLASITDPLGRVESFAYDPAGRVTTQTLPGGRVVQYAYDANGNLTSLTPPGRPAHAFTHTPVDLMASYVPPNVGAGTNQTLYTYNVDRQLTQVSRPDGQTVAFGYDAAGRVNATTIARGTISYAYSPTTGKTTSIAAPDGLGLTYGYDGALLKTVTWSGPVAGTVARTYDNDFRVTGIAVNGASVPFSYDADSLLMAAGAMTLTRNPQNGLLAGTLLGNVTDAWTYNGFAEPVQYTASYGGSPIFEQQFTRDTLGRIVQKVETIGGVTDTYGYSYDAAGRLAQVTKNAVVTATYAYDLNGNRLSVTTPGGTTTGTYDDQDRMTPYGTATYAYTASGELATKTDGALVTTYAYDALGNLTSTALPGGPSIGYQIDGRNRRVGKKVDSTATQGFLYQSDLRPAAELDGGNNVVSRFVYGTKVNVPEYLVKGGTTYRLVTDHLGSPRLVVDVATGSVAQRMDYDEFGRVLSDTNPGFQPFGFAGGLYDKDTKLVRFGTRDYDAVSGRWTRKDSAQRASELPNRYAYVANDPINLVDYNGFWGERPWQQWVDDQLLNLRNKLAKKASTVCADGVCVSVDGPPSISVGVSQKVQADDVTIAQFDACGEAGITPYADPKAPLFKVRYKLGAAIPGLAKLPVIGKYFSFSQSGGAELGDPESWLPPNYGNGMGTSRTKFNPFSDDSYGSGN